MIAPARLDVDAMTRIVEDYLARTDPSGWNAFVDFDWQAADANRLTEDQRLAVVFITYIEDHLPGYFAEYDRLFPVNDQVEREVYLHNRELYRFTVRWASEEERHAHALSLYQTRSGLARAEDLRRQLFDEGRRRFRLAHTDPMQVVMYTLVQEKATHLFYRALAQVVDEPVLRSILERLAQDEARHFAFFSRVLEAYVHRFGEAVIPPLRDALADFKMPLAETLHNYWRIALRISAAAGGYDYTKAFDDLVSVVQRAAGAASWSKTNSLVEFVHAIRQR
jgi:hypothetical protein